MTLDPEDIEAIASAVARRLGLQTGTADNIKLLELSPAERKAHVKARRMEQKTSTRKAA